MAAKAKAKARRVTTGVDCARRSIQASKNFGHPKPTPFRLRQRCSGLDRYTDFVLQKLIDEHWSNGNGGSRRNGSSFLRKAGAAASAGYRTFSALQKINRRETGMTGVNLGPFSFGFMP